MSKIPVLSYVKVVKALQRLGYVVVRQKGSHIRIQKKDKNGITKKATIPAHNPIKKNTLRQILKQLNIDLENFMKKL